MVLDLINLYKEKYKRLITEDPDYDELYKWESLKNFQDNWDIEAPDFGAMYDKSLTNEISSNLWASQFFYPKQTMLDFINLDQEQVRTMFRGLFDEEQDIEKRIDHFVYNCDNLLIQLQETQPNAKNHFHDGYRIISVYLCFRYPMSYTIYKFTEFKDFMESVKAKSIPGTKEISRFFKVMRTLYSILAKDETLIAIHNKLKDDSKYYQNESLLLAQDIYWCCSRYNIDKYTIKSAD